MPELNRKDVPVQDTWNLSDLFLNDGAWKESGDKIASLAQVFCEKYEGKLKGSDNVPLLLQAVSDFDDIHSLVSPFAAYAQLDYAADHTDAQKAAKAKRMSSLLSELSARLSFFRSELSELDVEVLAEAAKSEEFGAFLEEIIREKKHRLHPETERVLAALSGSIIDLPEESYSAAKLADMDFGSFNVNGEELPLSFSLFEEKYQYEPDYDIRHQAFQAFSDVLGNYRHTIATAYNAQVQKEVTLSRLRGYDSVTDYLLADHNVSADLYNRQLDLTGGKLAAPMRRYARKIQEKYGLAEMTWADLKLAPIPGGYPEVSRAQARDMIMSAVSVMGKPYQDIIAAAFQGSWIDFAENKGKSTGAFCAQPYGRHPYILVNWQNSMADVYTLAHELGHAAQTMISQEKNRALVTSPSTYFIEAPSTIHELFLTQYLMSDPKYKQMSAALMTANTFYHNFVTHLLEGVFQREVYSAAEGGKDLAADDFDEIKAKVLSDFWGKDVRLNPGAERTWMRQPHYYMGLYPYTYSAGLTVATVVSMRIAQGEKETVSDWLTTLAAGGTLDPVKLAALAGVDITTDEPLLSAISYVDSLIEQI
ncbi:MAG TPA: oligoendopeptidase F [Bacillota bacterium]|nr:oligoendopeptidase F [Bacillota bacterium]